MKTRTLALSLCMVMCLSACSSSKNIKETENLTEPETMETEVEQDMTQDPDLVILDQGATVEICDGAMIAQMQAPYSGVFLEDEKHDEVVDVYYVKFINCTDFMIETADITLGDDEGELLFHVDMVKAGESVFVAESDKKKADCETIRYIDSNINYVDDENIITEQVKVDSVSDKKLKITNLTGDFLSSLRIYYSPVNDRNIRISGAAYSVPIDGMEANQEMEVSIDGKYDTCKIIDIISIAE